MKSKFAKDKVVAGKLSANQNAEKISYSQRGSLKFERTNFIHLI